MNGGEGQHPGTGVAVQAPAARAAHRASRGVRPFRAIAWIGVYLGLVALPLVVLTLGPSPKGGGYWWDFAMALGFGGLAMMALQSALTARFRRATAPFGIDILYYFHRWAAVVAMTLVLGHYVILRMLYADAIGPVDPRAAAWFMTAGRLALALFAILIVTSIWRKQLRIEYDRWRAWHAVFAVAAVLLAVAHIWGVGHYTAAAWRGIVWGSYTVLWALVVGYVRLARPASLLRLPYRILAVRSEHGHSWTVTVKPEGHRGLAFSPGQFAWLTIGLSPFRAKEHPFSISSSAVNAGMLEFTIKELGDYTRTIGNVKVGTLAYVDGPHGVFTTDHYRDAPGFVFIAGGIGIAPIMSMLRTLADRGDRRPVRLIYGNRKWEDVVFREELQILSSQLDLTLIHVLQEPPANWSGLRGVLSEGVVRTALEGVALEAEYFTCGPKPMSDAVQRTLRRAGVPLNRVHCELFEMA
jgi:predicted ferric reductase